MDDLDRVNPQFMESLLAYDRAAELGGAAGKVLPADVDLDAELLARLDEFAE
jgi:hypothetical protein